MELLLVFHFFRNWLPIFQWKVPSFILSCLVLEILVWSTVNEYILFNDLLMLSLQIAKEPLETELNYPFFSFNLLKTFIWRNAYNAHISFLTSFQKLQTLVYYSRWKKKVIFQSFNVTLFKGITLEEIWVAVCFGVFFKEYLFLITMFRRKDGKKAMLLSKCGESLFGCSGKH